ncbi:uncharacterized protein L3040_008074 [Drepanopeziza brunnea f. sp. 'multigermtubi']|uniref:Manganese lipoxygenase n=1 Tax=Marssonina brunnea f. sp. multigermtubi (strain MB_m1) TaxID=1072389 RepID=K1WJB7_MARBU|nr:manganese lipoxygenase [Drepanopeziza brunnea f. sp. 'multigermtubi' MB_m1]EKD17740.1 manganese lipoxygenase [Drepanopeziza brunnea f. sp. 'multigermtubi' MB_m1]KAJ5035609.1 hypothetical protein L3040_008074 [Drepanopeziza brunnea f. sp. 'multigermtubi']
MHIPSSSLACVATLLTVITTTHAFATLPSTGNSSNVTARADAIREKAAGWLYGPSLIGNAAFFPTGVLAEKRIQSDIELFKVDSNFIRSAVVVDSPRVQQAIAANGGLNSTDDYIHVLYDGQWLNAVPAGTSKGILANYTSDLLFSMSRLSLNSWPLRRLARSDDLPFSLDDDTAVQITTLTLAALKEARRLFVVDHSYQQRYKKSPLRYGAACTALFFIHPVSGDFLPLAIKTNTGADLVYTPLDGEMDWMLAKIMFNSNDLLHAQLYHLVASHNVAEIVHQAAMRTMSDEHPIMLLLDRLLYQAYAARPVGDSIELFADGGAFDQAFHMTARGAKEFVAEWYPVAGRLKSNYLDPDLASRGLIECSDGPALKHFPFYEDVKPIHAGIKKFITSFVDTYYSSDAIIAEDTELAAWVTEARTNAQVLDFPCAVQAYGTVPPTCTKAHIIDLLTHIAYLVGVQHQALNTGAGFQSTGTLPLHPVALNAPLPTAKNVTDVLPWLLPPAAAVFQLNLLALFNRPTYESLNKTLVWQFSDDTFLSNFPSTISEAAQTFKETMEEVSRGIRAKTFDSEGLSQGMPFVYRNLDPGTVPFYLAI